MNFHLNKVTKPKGEKKKKRKQTKFISAAFISCIRFDVSFKDSAARFCRFLSLSMVLRQEVLSGVSAARANCILILFLAFRSADFSAVSIARNFRILIVLSFRRCSTLVDRDRGIM